MSHKQSELRTAFAAHDSERVISVLGTIGPGDNSDSLQRLLAAQLRTATAAGTRNALATALALIHSPLGAKLIQDLLHRGASRGRLERS